MISLFEYTSLLNLLVTLFLSFLLILLLIKCRALSSFIDPSMMAILQITMTAVFLSLGGLMPVYDLICFVIVIALFMLFGRYRDKKKLISEKDWISFGNFLLLVSFVFNIYLLIDKGFILFSDDLALAKVSFYENYGLFKRINEISIPILGLSGLYYILFYKKKLYGSVILLYVSFLIFTVGSKAGLLYFLFIFGALIHFKKAKFEAGEIFLLSIPLLFSSLFLFYLIYGKDFLTNFYIRFISYVDGPFYYYIGGLGDKITYGLDYVLNLILVNLRILNTKPYTGIGQVINYLYSGYESELYGPNPQIFVEATVMLGEVRFLYYIYVFLIFIFCRYWCATPFSFLIGALFFNALLIDMPYAVSNIINILMVLFLFFFYRISHLFISNLMSSINYQKRSVRSTV